ncbi:acetylcholine receptor subunit beta-like [Haliotis rubra]|uniref:acetylcholine receptor subunit beta-like n=1 Tax=Haliotis rubra TaxID=36100 RepID=UPI001EE5CDAE|nr:acetylcholine receptor subunit beta-like [Haliotis rubra]
MDRGLVQLLLAIALYRIPVLGFTFGDGSKLRTDLLANYSLKVRPEGVTDIDLAFNILTVNELETRTQTFSVSGYFTVVWNDTRLQWNTQAYDNITFLFTDETEIWRPALVVKNAVDDLDVIASDNIPIRVNNGGNIYWNPPGIYKTHCDIDITYYPFDSQECSVIVQSWGYNLRELDLKKHADGVITSEYERNGEWGLTEAFSFRQENVRKLSSDSNTYATVAFKFRLQRRPGYYAINIILPVVVLSILSALVFVLPPDSGEKMGYSLTVLLSFAVFLTLIADRMPTTSRDTSFMAVYLAVILCLGALSVVLTIVVLELNSREGEVPPWLEKTTRVVIRPFICVRSFNRKSRSVSVSSNGTMADHKFKDIQNIQDKVHRSDPTDADDVTTSPSTSSRTDMTWQDVGRAFDALFFRLYFGTVATFTIVFLVVLSSTMTDSKTEI